MAESSAITSTSNLSETENFDQDTQVKLRIFHHPCIENIPAVCPLYIRPDNSNMQAINRITNFLRYAYAMHSDVTMSPAQFNYLNQPDLPQNLPN